MGLYSRYPAFKLFCIVSTAMLLAQSPFAYYFLSNISLVVVTTIVVFAFAICIWSKAKPIYFSLTLLMSLLILFGPVDEVEGPFYTSFTSEYLLLEFQGEVDCRSKKCKVKAKVHRAGQPSASILFYFPKSCQTDFQEVGACAFKGKLIPVAPSQDFQGRSYLDYLKSTGIKASLSLYDSEVVDLFPRSLEMSFLESCRLRIKNNLEWHLSPSSSSLGIAMLLGDKSSLSKEQKHSFKGAGALHVLAVSGMHVGIIYLCVSKLFWYLLPFLSRRRVGWFALLAVWFFVALTGFGSPAIRAAILISLYRFGKDYYYQLTGLNLLFFSAVAILIFWPDELFAIGFQLSYGAVLGIMILYNPLKQRFQSENKIVDLIYSWTSLSIAAQLGTLPFVLYYFQSYPIYSLVSNYFMMPLSFVLLVGFLLVAIIAPISFLADYLGAAVDWVVNFTFYLTDLVSAFPLAIYPIGIETSFLFYGAVLLWTYLLWVVHRKQFHLPAFLALALSMLFFLSSNK
ncbi:ComEC/Rec2 family competence protein [Chitinophagales bacterium]|nr:ComEC/Rec2 family competence protein [Chitinophagales bacterium]